MFRCSWALCLCAVVLACGRTQLIPCAECRADLPGEGQGLVDAGMPAFLDAGPRRDGGHIPRPTTPFVARWVRRFPVPTDRGEDKWIEGNVAVAPNDDVLVAAHSLPFDERHPERPAGLRVLRYSADGARLFESLSVVQGPEPTVEARIGAREDGGMVLAGDVRGSISLGSLAVTDTAFVLALDASGGTDWGQQWRTASWGSVWLKALQVAPDGDIVLGGCFYGDADLGDGPLDGGTSDSDRGFRPILIRLTPRGARRWVRVFGSNPPSRGGCIEQLRIGPTGTIYAGGRQFGGADFGGGAMPSIARGYPEVMDAGPFFVVFNPDGRFLAQQDFIGPTGQAAEGLVEDLTIGQSGEVILSGEFAETFLWDGVLHDAFVMDGVSGYPGLKDFVVSVTPDGGQGASQQRFLSDPIFAVTARPDGGFYEAGTGYDAGVASQGLELLSFEDLRVPLERRLVQSGRANYLSVRAPMALLSDGDLIVLGESEATINLGSGPAYADAGVPFLSRIHP